MAAEPSSAKHRSQLQFSFEEVARYVPTIASLAILFLGLWVVFNPGMTYAPVPRVVLFALVALLPAILFGTQVAVRLKLRLKGVSLVAGGVAALIFVLLYLLNYLAKPELQVVVVHILDQQNQSLKADPVRIETRTPGGYAVDTIVDKGKVVLLFPEQAATTVLCLQTISDGPEYCGDIDYAGNVKLERKIGTDLTAR